MKIIKKDSLNRNTVSDELIAENVHPYMACHIAKLLNNHGLNQSSFKVVPDTYNLYRYNENETTTE